MEYGAYVKRTAPNPKRRTSAPIPVTFFYPCPENLERDIKYVDRIQVDRDLEFWNTPQEVRRRTWTLQTYARLREADYDGLTVSETLPRKGIVLFVPEPDIVRAFHRQWTSAHRGVLICTMRADVVDFRFPFADAEIVQNGRFADEERSFFIPHWIQPGLIPRDPSRGDRIQTITYKGDRGNLHPAFRSEPFARFLEDHGLEFKPVGPQTSEERHEFSDWHDYSESDLVLALRKSWVHGGLRPEKPASKLVNAWHAGTPALLGPEYAYRELRQSDLDYLEITSMEDAIAAIERLRNTPRLYRAMIENGRERARAFTPERIAARWADVLFKRLPALLATRQHRLARRLPMNGRRVLNYVTRPPTPLEFKKQLGYVYRKVKRRL